MRKCRLSMALTLCVMVSIAVGRAGAADLTTDDLTVEGAATFYGDILAETATPAVTPTNGLVLYYSFDTNSGSVVYDESGSGLSGIVYNASWTTNGLGSGAYDFDGDVDYIDTGGFTSSVNQTISIWVNTTTPTQTKGTVGAIWNGTWSWPNIEWNYALFDASPVHSIEGWASYSTTADAMASSSTNLLNDGEWHNVTLVFTEDTFTVYEDGETADGVQTMTSNRNLLTANVSFRLGANYETDIYCFDGLLDEIRFYDRALTAQEVSNIYHAMVDPDPEPGDITLKNGVKYTAPLGDISMGSYTNQP